MKSLRFIFRCCFFLLFPVLALAQGVFVPPQTALKAVNGITTPIAGATITVCGPGASGLPCAPALVNSIFKDAALTQTLANPFPADANGNYQFAIAAGNYTVTVTALGYSGYSYQVSAGMSGGSSGLIGNFTPGCIPVAAPAGSLLPLNCSSLTENGGVVRTPEPAQAFSFMATCINCGLDMTAGDGSNLGFSPNNGHSYLWTDASNNDALRVGINGNDTGDFLPLNPSGTVYHVNGIAPYLSTCGLLQSLPANSIVTVYSDIQENFTCNPFAAASGLVLQLHLSGHNTLYTSDVPITLIKTNDALVGEIRARSGAAIYRGSGIAPSATYAASNNPWVPTGPTGFTISAINSGVGTCAAPFIAAGTYRVGITWGPDFNRESGVNATPGFTDGWMEQTVVLGASQCFNVVHPGSPPANVTRYNVYICHQNGCGSGTELWQQQLPIASNFTLTATSSFAVGSGSPPLINTTGAFIAMASESAANASASNVLFGVRVRDLSIDCSQNGLALAATPGCIGVANFNSEEESAIERIDFNEVGGPVDIYVGFNSIGLAASNSAVRVVSLNNGSLSNPSVAGVYLDSIETFRGLDDITDTQASVPSCVIAIGSSLQPVSGTSITNAHFEKCTTGINLISFHGSVNNVTCAPTSTTTCVQADINSTVSIHAVRGGSADNPINDLQTGFVSAKSYECCYEGDLVFKPSLIVGLTPTSCTMTNSAGTITCGFSTGASNAAGKMTLNTVGAQGLSGTLQLNFIGTFGVNAGLCTFVPEDQAGVWTLPVTFKATALGTGQWAGAWQAGANLTGGTTYALTYHCDPI